MSDIKYRQLSIVAYVLGVAIVALLLLVAAMGLFFVPTESSPAASQAKPLESARQAAVAHQDAIDVLDDGLEAYARKDTTRLELAIERAASQPVSRASLQLLDALKLVLQQNVEGALKLLHSAAEDPTVRPRALACAGELLFKKGDWQNAEAVLREALIGDPNQPEPHRYLAAFYYDVGAMDNALLHLAHVARLDPGDARPWRMRGIILSDFERHVEAIQAYNETLKRGLEPHVEQEVRAELAASLLAARQPAESLKHLQFCDSSAEIESLRADCHLSLGDYAAAETSLQLALKLDPDHARSLMIKTTLAREQGDSTLAEQTLQHAVDKHPYEFDFRAQLMSVLAAQGKKEAAEEQRAEMERLQALRTKFTELHHQSMRDPSSASLRYELGKTAEELGKLEMAVSWYQASIALDPSHEDANRALRALTKERRRP